MEEEWSWTFESKSSQYMLCKEESWGNRPMPLKVSAIGCPLLIVCNLNMRCIPKVTFCIPKMVRYIPDMMHARSGICSTYGLKQELYKSYCPTLKFNLSSK